MDCSPPGSTVHRILQERILEWVAISFSRGSSQPNPEIEPRSPALRADSFTFWATREAQRKTQREKKNQDSLPSPLPYPLTISLEAEGGEYHRQKYPNRFQLRSFLDSSSHCSAFHGGKKVSYKYREEQTYPSERLPLKLIFHSAVPYI